MSSRVDDWCGKAGLEWRRPATKVAVGRVTSRQARRGWAAYGRDRAGVQRRGYERNDLARSERMGMDQAGLVRQAGIGTESMLQARDDGVRMLMDWSGRHDEEWRGSSMRARAAKGWAGIAGHGKDHSGADGRVSDAGWKGRRGDIRCGGECGG